MGQYSATGKDVTLPALPTATELGLGDVNPIQDVTIKSLRLTDDTEANVSGISDPVAGRPINDTERLDEFDGSDIRVQWETSIPEVQGINVVFAFDFRVKIQKGINGDTLSTITGFKPSDWNLGLTTFEMPLEDIIDISRDSSGGVDLASVPREFTITIDAHDAEGNYSSGNSNTAGYDKIYIANPKPRKADKGCCEPIAECQNCDTGGFCITTGNLPSTGNCIEGFIDINGHIKIFNTNRPIDAQAVYIIAAKNIFRCIFIKYN